MIEWMQAAEALEQGTVQPVYVLVGTELLLMRLFVERLCRRMSREAGEEVRPLRFAFEEHGCEEAVMACDTVGLFAARDVVVLENCTAMLSAGKAKADTEDLESYLERPTEGRVFVITVHGEKLDERKRLVKLAKRHAVVNCGTPRDAQALRILSELVRDRQMVVEPGALQELWRRTGSLSLCDAELDKLWTYTCGAPVRVRDVAELVADRPEDNVFRWVDAVMNGNAERAFRTLRDVHAAGYDALALLALVARQLRLLWMTRWYMEQGLSHAQIGQRLGVHPYAVRTAAGMARTVPPQTLEDLLCVVADAEYQVKSGRGDADQVLDWAVMACLARSRGHGWAV